MTNEIIGKNVVITGGTSGLGKELARQYINLGANVAIIARGESGLQGIANELNLTEGQKLVTIRGDVSSIDDIYPMAGTISSKLGAVDVLINAASTLGVTPLKLLADTECEDLSKVLETNLVGPFRLIKALLPSMLLRKSGVVVNISSDAAVSAYPTWGAYSVSKAALDHMTHIFNEELKEQGINFLAIDPGDMNTPMHFAAIPEANPENLKDPAVSAKQIIGLIQSRNFEKVRYSL